MAACWSSFRYVATNFNVEAALASSPSGAKSAAYHSKIWESLTFGFGVSAISVDEQNALAATSSVSAHERRAYVRKYRSYGNRCLTR